MTAQKSPLGGSGRRDSHREHRRALLVVGKEIKVRFFPRLGAEVEVFAGGRCRRVRNLKLGSSDEARENEF